MGLTSFNRMRRLQEAKKKDLGFKPKVTAEEIEKVLKALEPLNPSKEVVDKVVVALKLGTVSVEKALEDIEMEIAEQEQEARNKENHEINFPSEEACTQEEAEKMIESGEATIPEESSAEDAIAEESLEEAPKSSKSNKSTKKKNT